MNRFTPHHPQIKTAVLEDAAIMGANEAARKHGISARTVRRWVFRLKPKNIANNPQRVSRVLVIPDLHCPWQHPDALAFLCRVRGAYHTNMAVCLGDEIDAMGFSRYPKDPDAPSAGRELETAIEQLEPFYRAFPDMMVCESNHTVRPWKKAFEAGLPASFLPTIARVLRAPDGWVWKNHWEIDGVFYHHGDMGISGYGAHLQLMKKLKQSAVIGHIHSYAGVNYEGEYFGMNAGCLIDTQAICFKYAKNMPIPVSLGCGIVINGKQAHFIPMHTDESGRWTGKL